MKMMELFSSTEDVKFEEASADHFFVRKEIGGSKITFDVEAAHSKPNEWFVEFYTGTEEPENYDDSDYEMTNNHNSIAVFSWIVTALKAFIAQHDPVKLYFSASKKDKSRESAYERIFSKIPGYKLHKMIEAISMAHYELIRIKQPVKESVSIPDLSIDLIKGTRKTIAGKFNLPGWTISFVEIVANFDIDKLQKILFEMTGYAEGSQSGYAFLDHPLEIEDIENDSVKKLYQFLFKMGMTKRYDISAEGVLYRAEMEFKGGSRIEQNFEQFKSLLKDALPHL
jgi:hypothetical protein